MTTSVITKTESFSATPMGFSGIPPEEVKNIFPKHSEELAYMSFEEYCANPPDNAEWVDGKVIAKGTMGSLFGGLQIALGILLSAFVKANGLNGRILSEVLCQSLNRTRKPDLAWMSPRQKELYGDKNYTIFPECFALIVEVISPTDIAEEVFSKAREYLQAGGEEVWLIFPENRLIFVAVMENEVVQWQLFTNNQVAISPKVLVGFSVNVNEFFTY
jgi:Uma2 family endonuclease